MGKQVGKNGNSYQDEDDDIIDEVNIEFATMENKKVVTLGKYDPQYKHLVVGPGLNFKGKCPNINCRAHF